MSGTNQNEPSPSPGGSNFIRTTNINKGGAAPETSNLQDLSQSVLHTPTLMSNFNKKRGFLDVNRLLHQPTFDPERARLQLANDKPSSTGMLNQNQMQGVGANEMSSHTQVLWGTNINTNDVQIKLKNFINNFEEMRDDDDDDDDAQYQRAPYYIQKLREVRELDGNVLDIDCDHVFQFDQMLYRQIEDYPADLIPIFDLVVTQVYKELDMYNIGGQTGDNDADYNMNNDEFGNDQIIQVRPHNLRKVYRIRELGPPHIEKLVSLRGIIIRTSDIVPEMKEAHFTCTKCFREEERSVQMGRIQEPTWCVNCEQRDTFMPNYNASIFSDKQHVKVQETPESVPEGETPQTIHLCAYEDLVDDVRPGDRVEITGIYKAMGIRVNANKRTLKNVYRTYVDVVTYVKSDKRRFELGGQELKDNAGADNVTMKEEHHDAAAIEEPYKPQLEVVGADPGVECTNIAFKDQEIAEFEAFAQRSDVQDILVDSLAPSIWESNDVKKGILCQLFGGVSKEFSQSGRGRFRGEINVLLCGDPSTAKSQLLQYVHKIAPRGIYTSGKGSSAVGLTVYITKDPETKELVLESGALVLSDRGICCIDEFDKMDDNTRTILHEAMEQQTVSVAKAGIICTLNARTAILAAANPVHSKYDSKLSVVENIQLPPTLLSRFDLIYLMLDKGTEASDRRLANHIVSLYSSPEAAAATDEHMTAAGSTEHEVQATNLIATNKTSRAFLARYISYARQQVQPEIPDEMVEVLVNEYKEMRSMGNNAKTITATPRQLESLIRISESLAKMRLSKRVEVCDIDEGVRLIKTAMQQSATDPKTGEIDMDIIATGIGAASNARIKEICTYIRKVQADFRDRVAQSGVKYHNLFDYLNSKVKEGILKDEVKETDYRDALLQLEEENVISLVGHKQKPTIRFVSD